MKGSITKLNVSIIFSLILITLTSSVSFAQESSRKGKWELSLFSQYMSGDTVTYSKYEEGEIDDTFTGGIGLGYSFNDYLMLNVNTWFGSPDVTYSRGYSEYSGDTDIWGTDLNLDYNILKTRLTPFVSAGLGFMHFSGEVGSGWYSQEISETDFSYNLGVGLRWDITDNFLVKAAYKSTWTELEDADDKTNFDGFCLTIGYVF